MKSRTTANSHSGRRRFLQLLGLAGAGGLAGCLGDSDDDDSVADEPTDDESPDEPTDDESADEPTDDESPDEPAAGPELRDILNWDTSYVMELAVPLGSGTVFVYEEDTYTQWTINGVEMEAYRIGTDAYIVVDGECLRPDVVSDDEIFEPDRLLAEFGGVVPGETSTIDGQEVYVFDVDDGLLYVSVESGYPLRFEDENDGAVIDFHSWGETEPISPPDMDCPEQ